MAAVQVDATATGAPYGRDVEIHLELPRCKVDELVSQLSVEGTALQSRMPLALVARLEVVRPQGQQTPLNAHNFDPIAKLAQLRDIQDRYKAIVDLRDKAVTCRHILESLPEAGAESADRIHPQRLAAANTNLTLQPAAAPPHFPSLTGLPFPYRGVPGVLSPRIKPPPEPVPDPLENMEPFSLDGDGLDKPPHLPSDELLFAKDGMDMAFSYFREQGQKMLNTVKEIDRQIDSYQQVNEARRIGASGDAVTMFLHQQRTIAEQQRRLDEEKYDERIAEERIFWQQRELRQQQRNRITGRDGV
eukprot:4510127-Amphidinium_carterae.1